MQDNKTFIGAILLVIGIGALILSPVIGLIIACILVGSWLIWGCDFKVLPNNEKMTKLAKALGIKWQVIPERRRWVTVDTPDPNDDDDDQEVLVNLVQK